ncbi:MAG: hypothetical protein Kow0013_11790 [Pararhodobacter sp.]
MDDLDPQLLLQPDEVAVVFATQVDQQAVIREFDKGLHRITDGGRGGQRADAQMGLLVGWGLDDGT